MSRKAVNRIGDEITTAKCGVCTIVDKVDSKTFRIKFKNTGYETNISASNIFTGKIKDPYHRSVCGVGYIGEKGIMSDKYKIKRDYTCWLNMLNRCYGGKHKGYDQCTVNPRWHCYANFSDDIQTLPGYDCWLDPSNKYQLDKDIKYPGNKEYSIAACQFVSQQENIAHSWKRRKEVSKDD